MRSRTVSPNPREVKQLNVGPINLKQTSKIKSKQVILNAHGVNYKVPLNSFEKFPDSRLGKIKTLIENSKGSTLTESLEELCDKYDSKSNTFYFNRDAKALNLILNFFNTGIMHVEQIACGYLLKDEFDYWNLGEECISDCCRENYHQIIDEIDEKIKDEEKIIKKYKAENDFGKSCMPKVKAKAWEIIESKRTWLSKIFFFFSFLVWLLIMFTIVLETINNAMTSTAYWDICYLVVSFFSLELILRIIFCPSKLKFFLDPLHLIDFVCITQDLIFIALLSTTSTTSVVGNGQNNNNGGKSVAKRDIQVRALSTPSPSSVATSGSQRGPAPGPPGGGPIGGVTLSTATSETLQKYNKILRFFYVLKIFRYFSSLRILAHAIVKGWKALVLYASYLLVGGLIFATFVYYAENYAADWNDSGNSAFNCVTKSMWWAIITMTTVGYGKFIGSLAAVFGIIMLAMPVGLLSNSFQEVYANQKFQKGVIERHLNSQANVQNKNSEKDSRIIESQNNKEHVVVDISKNARQTNEK